MKIVALEEHITTPEVCAAWEAAEAGEGGPTRGRWSAQLAEHSEGRLADMDDEGIDVQVISLTAPGVQNVAAAEAPTLARNANDAVATIISAHPDRFQGFATLPTSDPAQSVTELRRCVLDLGLCGAMLNGRTGERNIDHPAFAELWTVAADLGVPIYIHPTRPTAAVRQAYYSGFGEPFDGIFATHGLGWHFETGLQLIRLIYAGTFDRHPELQVIVGHWGELVLFFAERIQRMDAFGAGTEQPLLHYLRNNVFYTGSGINSHRYLRWAIEVVGIDRIMFSADYPFVASGEPGAARRFVADADLSDTDREKVAHGNWERLIADRGRSENAGSNTSEVTTVE